MALKQTITPRQFFRAVYVFAGVTGSVYDAAFAKAVEGGFIETTTTNARHYATRQRAEYQQGRNPISDYERD